MDIKYLIIFSILLSSFVFAVEQGVKVDVLAVPEMFLGDNPGESNETDTNGTVYATLENNDAFECQINWEEGYVDIDPSETSANNTYYELGEKIVNYRCKGEGQEYVEVNDTIEILRVPPLINLIQPVSTSYEDERVLIDVLINKRLVNLEYGIDDSRPKGLCRNCGEYNRSKNFKDGFHNLSVIATDKFGELDRQNVSFFVDSTEPKIKKTFPKRDKYTNGSFSVEYDEEFLHNITLHYNGSLTKFDCPTGKKQVCEFNVDLSEHDNETIEYWFDVGDMFFNEVQRRPIKVKVDTTVPEITKLDYNITRRRVEFDIEISEETNLEYLDENDSRPRFKRLCGNCDSYNRKKSFSAGEHNLTFRATDNAGNFDEEKLIFLI
ncbi:MAG: hypothetical protein AABW46_01640 [Nanoarchaeota archaeon]